MLSEIKTVININKTIRDKASRNKNDEQSIYYFCELMLMEKMFGFCNLCRIFEVKTAIMTEAGRFMRIQTANAEWLCVNDSGGR